MIRRTFEIQRTIIKRKIKILERLLEDIEEQKSINGKDVKDDLELLTEDLAIVRKQLEKDVIEYEKLKDECGQDEWEDEQEAYEDINISIDSSLSEVELETKITLLYIKKAESRKIIKVEGQSESMNFASNGNATNKCSSSDNANETPRNKGVSKINITNLDIKDDISNCEETSPEEGKNSGKNSEKNPDEDSSIRQNESNEDLQDVQVKPNEDDGYMDTNDMDIDPEYLKDDILIYDDKPPDKEKKNSGKAIYENPEKYSNMKEFDKCSEDDRVITGKDLVYQQRAESSGNIIEAPINNQDAESMEIMRDHDVNDEQKWNQNKFKKKRTSKGKKILYKNKNKFKWNLKKKMNQKMKKFFDEKIQSFISTAQNGNIKKVDINNDVNKNYLWIQNRSKIKEHVKRQNYFDDYEMTTRSIDGISRQILKQQLWIINTKMKKKKRAKTPTTIVTWMISDHVDNNNNGLQDDDILVAPGAQTRTCRAENKPKQQQETIQQEVHLDGDDVLLARQCRNPTERGISIVEECT